MDVAVKVILHSPSEASHIDRELQLSMEMHHPNVRANACKWGGGEGVPGLAY